MTDRKERKLGISGYGGSGSGYVRRIPFREIKIYTDTKDTKQKIPLMEKGDGSGKGAGHDRIYQGKD